MINKGKKTSSFSQREIASSANNLVIQSLRPASIGEIPESRLRKLRAYSQALIAPLTKHLETGVFRPEEVVMILATGALFVQMRHVMRTDKIPSGQRVADIYEGEAVVLPEAYLATAEPNDDEILPRMGKPGRRKK